MADVDIWSKDETALIQTPVQVESVPIASLTQSEFPFERVSKLDNANATHFYKK